jgi:hypothetical protein
MCNNRIPGAPEDVESQLEMLKNIDNIPRLILCDSCKTEYGIPSWVLLKEKTPPSQWLTSPDKQAYGA